MNTTVEQITKIDSSITKMCKKIYATGSRVICNPAPTDTDEDFIVLVDGEYFFDLIQELCANKYELGGSDVTPSEDFAPDMWEGFQSYKKGEVNLIVTCSEEFFGKFVLATIIAKNKNLLVKEGRIALFQKILYGEGQ